MENDRRTFIKGLFSLGAICSMSPLDILAVNNTKVNKILPADIGTIITVAQFAIGAAKLFQGSSTSGISDLQIKLLQNISKQLQVVQDGITIILKNLEEIRKDIEQIDEKVVETLNSMSIQGNILSFDEIMRTWARENDKEKFFNDRKVEMENLITEIRKHRNVLFQFDNYLNIPILCSALYIEYNLMHLVKETDERIKSAIESYRNYFSRLLSPSRSYPRSRFLSNNLAGKIEGLKINLSGYKLDRTYVYPYTAWISPNSLRENVAIGTFNVFLMPGELSKIEKAEIDNLTTLGLIEPHHLPRRDIIVSLYSRKYTWTTAVADTLKSNGALNNPTSADRLPTYDAEFKRVSLEAQKMADELNLKIYNLYSAVSCFYAGNRALNFCQKFDLS